MTAVKYGPDETWPSHEKPHWRQPLAAARHAGWTLTYINAPHRFGVVSCPAGQHIFVVDKTAGGSETKAKEALKKIKWCTHPVGDVRDRQEEAQGLLELAARLIAEADEGLRAAEAKRGALAELDRLELRLATAESNVDAALIAAQDAALEAAVEFDDAPDPPTLGGKLEQATSAVSGGESIAKSVKAGHPGAAGPLLKEADSLRSRIDELRRRLADLQEQDCSSQS